VRRLLRALVGPNWELVNRRLAGFLYLPVHLRMSRAGDSAAKLLTKAGARRIAANIAKLPEVLRRT
jgi:hypothetical protein